MKILQLLLILFILVINFQNCTPKVTKLIGEYSSIDSSLESDEYQFNEKKEFVYRHRSDDISSNKLGRGMYSIEGKKIILNFEDLEELKTELDISLLEDEVIGKRNYEFRIIDIAFHDLPYVNIMLKNSQSEMLVGAVTDAKGFCQIELAKNADVQQIEISYVGMKKLIIDIADQKSKAFSVQLRAQETYFEKGDQLVFEFRIDRSQLFLKNGKKKQRLVKMQYLNITN